VGWQAIAHGGLIATAAWLLSIGQHLGWLLGLFVVSLVPISQIEHRRNRERIPSA
jgi:hypothetical protein